MFVIFICTRMSNNKYRFLFQVAHLRYFIFFRLQMGFVDNIVAKCEYPPNSSVYV